MVRDCIAIIKGMQTPNSFITALQNPALYPHPVTGFHLIETHLSWIILTGPYAYKIKKPLNLGFQDFTTSQKRQHYCELEIQYNQPLAGDIYCSVISITGTPQSPVLNEMKAVSTNDITFEYAIKMKQFDPHQAFNFLADKKSLQPSMVTSVAKKIAQFHQHQPADTDHHYGTPANIFSPMEDNFNTIRQLVTDPKKLNQLDHLYNWTHHVFEQYRDILDMRKQQGYIRACHGDLHLGNIVLYHNKPLVFDCIEFNEDFRWIDVMSDIGFLTMDLILHQLKPFKYLFLNTYLDHTLDYEGVILLPLYESYRAMVRAKIYLLQAQQISEKTNKFIYLMNQVAHYLDIAESSTLQQIPPSLTITFGVSGSGKSYHTRQLSMTNDSICLRSDIFRKRFFHLDPFKYAPLSRQKDIYSDKMTKTIYQQLVDTAEKLLKANQSVIIDATCLKQWQRKCFSDLAKKLKIPFKILTFDAPQNILIERLQQRDHNNDHTSDATEAIVNDQLSQQDPLSEEELKFTERVVYQK